MLTLLLGLCVGAALGALLAGAIYRSADRELLHDPREPAIQRLHERRADAPRAARQSVPFPLTWS